VDGGGVVGVAGQLGVDGLGEESQVDIHVRPDAQGALQQLQGVNQDALQAAFALLSLAESIKGYSASDFFSRFKGTCPCGM